MAAQQPIDVRGKTRCKILVQGRTGVGKSTLSNRLIGPSYSGSLVPPVQGQHPARLQRLALTSKERPKVYGTE